MTDCVKIIEVVEQPTRVVDVAQAVGGTGLSAFQLAVEGGYVGTVQDWLASLVGDTGLSAYEVAVSEGFTGTVEDWLTSLTGPAGASAYDVAADEGFPGSVEDWLASLKGDAGASAYDLWLDAGNTGTVNDFLNSLVGPAGVGVPTGGTSGQVLAKTSGTDFDTEWVAPPAAPVTSVNSETGDVVLDAGDVGAAPIVHGHTASDVSGLATVATSGSYDDLTDTPGPGFSGDYDDLANKPSIPTVPGDIGAQPAGDYATGAQGELADTAVQPNDLAAVATSGSYDDLGDKPTIPTQASDVGAATAAQGVKADSAVQPGDLATVAVSGEYDDLAGKPSIPSTAADVGAIPEPAQDGTSGQALVTDGAGGRTWETISGGGASLPDGDQSGDVLTWDGTEWDAAQPADQLPEPGANTEVLTVVDGDWKSAPAQGGTAGGGTLTAVVEVDPGDWSDNEAIVPVPGLGVTPAMVTPTTARGAGIWAANGVWVEQNSTSDTLFLTADTEPGESFHITVTWWSLGTAQTLVNIPASAFEGNPGDVTATIGVQGLGFRPHIVSPADTDTATVWGAAGVWWSNPASSTIQADAIYKPATDTLALITIFED